MAALSNISRRNLCSILIRNRNRFISTSEKKKDSNESSASEAVYKKIPDFSKPLENKNWVSYGFDLKDKQKDTYYLHLFTFSFISVFVCGFAFLYAYMPDRKMKDWAKREAFMVLNEREQLGLSPINPNYIDPDQMVLPPDEELTDEDIII